MKSVFTLLFLSSFVTAAPFDCMVGITRQDPSLDWWYAVPQEFVPHINRISSVSKDEYFCILPIFRNYMTDSNEQARITFDVEVIRPDGSVDVSLEKCDGHVGSATPPLLLPLTSGIESVF